MDYEVKYKQALERARQFSEHPLQEDSATIVEYIFPEPKGERIKKAIVAYISHGQHCGISNTDMIAWLEKQWPFDNDKVVEDTLKYVARQFMHWLDVSTSKDEMCLSNMECEDIENAFLKDDWARITHYMKKKLEKQGENKPTDKVESKFHKGEWIIHQGTENIYQVIARIDNQYQLKYGDNYTIQKCADVDRDARLWTIEDAKDGDVLVTTGRGCPFIYRKTDYNNNLAYYYAGIDGNGDFCEGCIKRTLCHFGSLSNVVPATKEQRELLFAKMTEAGYEWDAEKKELKKMEVASKEREEKQMIERLKSCVYAADLTIDGRNELIAWLEKQGKKVNADEVIDWIKTHGNFWLVVTREINKVIAKFKEDFKI